jgi:hypothetical protein
MSKSKTEINFFVFCRTHIETYRLLQSISADFKRDCKKLEQNILRSQAKQIETKIIKFIQDYINKPDSINQLIEQYYPSENTGIYFYEV